MSEMDWSTGIMVGFSAGVIMTIIVIAAGGTRHDLCEEVAGPGAKVIDGSCFAKTKTGWEKVRR